jgi:hypothetical protein
MLPDATAEADECTVPPPPALPSEAAAWARSERPSLEHLRQLEACIDALTVASRANADAIARTAEAIQQIQSTLETLANGQIAAHQALAKVPCQADVMGFLVRRTLDSMQRGQGDE